MKRDPADDQLLAEKIVSFLPYIECGATMEMILKDMLAAGVEFDRGRFRYAIDRIYELTGVHVHVIGNTRTNQYSTYSIRGAINKDMASRISRLVLDAERRQARAA